MSFGFFGIQFGFALQNANVSRIFETLGADLEKIPILWIAAPITGLLIQPIIGHMSDRTWCKLGRRRPYFLVGAILASLALFIMPHSPVLWVAAGMLWIMDASINISMEPFRAFVGDMLPSEQRTMGFSMQSFFIGAGAIIASALPWLLTKFGVSNTAPEGIIPPSVKISFFAGAAIFVTAVVWTVFSTKEYSPEELAKYNEEEADAECERDEAIDTKKETPLAKKIGFISLLLGIIATAVIYFLTDAKGEVYIFSLGLIAFGLLEIIVSIFLINKGKTKNGLSEVLLDLNNMPKTMRQLAVVQFFSWFALFAMWIYTTPAVTSSKYDMQIDNKMVTFFNKELPLIDTAKYGVSEEDYNKKTEELEKYNQHLTTDETTNASVTFVSFFINKSIDEEIIYNELNSFVSSNTNSDIPEEVIEDIEKYKDSDDQIDLKHATLNYAISAYNSSLISLPEEIVTKMPFYLRIKEIRQEYNDGADWVGICFAAYNGAAAILAFLLMFMAKKTNRKTTHAISLFVGSLSFISIFFIKDPNLLLVSFVGIGLVWASILAMPYAILTGSLPAKKMGTYMGIFNFFIVIPQILAASILGFFVKSLFNEKAIYALLLGGVSFLIAAISVLFVEDKN